MADGVTEIQQHAQTFFQGVFLDNMHFYGDGFLENIKPLLCRTFQKFGTFGKLLAKFPIADQRVFYYLRESAAQFPFG